MGSHSPFLQRREVIEGMPAGEDHIIRETEYVDVLLDILLYEARSRISDNNKYERLKRHLSSIGFNYVTHGKNRSLDGKFDKIEISLTHNYKLNRHRFEFCFPKDFSLMECHLFIHRFLKKIHDNPDDYKIDIVGSSEFALDLKNFGFEFIENLIKAANKLRTKNELFFQYRDKVTKALIKTYQTPKRNEGKTVRIEGKTKNIRDIAKHIEKYLNEKNAIFNLELQDQIWREIILQLIQEDKENSSRILGEILRELTEINDKNEAIIDILLGLAANQEKQTEIVNLQIQHNQLLQENLTQNYETLFHQNQDLSDKTNHISNRIDDISNQNSETQVIQSIHLIEIKNLLSQPQEQKKELSHLFSNMPTRPIPEEEKNRIIRVLKAFWYFILKLLELIKRLFKRKEKGKGTEI